MKIDIEFNSGAQLPMDAIPELARLAEAHGFDCAWGGEANNKDPTVMLSAIAAVTSRLKVGSAIYHILGRTPATLALQAVGLDELSGGRFLLGIGSSNPTYRQMAWTDSSITRSAACKNTSRSCAPPWAARNWNYQGKYFTAQNFKMAFKPSGRTMPIYLAAFGSQMTQLAGRISDGVLINYGQSYRDSPHR
jgi:alkanesulfonate monooxygenase SsuD/methylene tetrahydromethanopterin reductase-like flavin-dependent oxidoreductase (luciferase family)